MTEHRKTAFHIQPYILGSLSVILLAFAGIANAHADESRDSLYYEVNKSLMVFGDLFRQVNSNYVDDVETEEMLRHGLDGMLNYLDPYTNYITNDESDQVDMLTKGFYGGLGVTISDVDGETTVVDLAQGFAADKAGIRIGDKIYKIDSTVVLNADHKELRQYTRGKAGSKLTAWIIREGRQDTLRFDLKRQKITMRMVSHAGFVRGEDGSPQSSDIAYIKLDRFARGANNQFRRALDDLKREKPLKGLIIDLRGNPGGLLDAAVSISEIFVPTGSPVVSTRGRSPLAGKEYIARGIPKAPNVPIVVLINNGSASASEILAAAIQDLDRGVLVGERSFGKGLVQTISSLPFEATLKMTTARYYTPSGRCIQRIKYEERREHAADDEYWDESHVDSSKVFYTSGRRPVYEANGIHPDVTVSSTPVSDYVQSLLDQNMLFRFGTRYSSKFEDLPEDFKIDKSVLQDFGKFLEDQEFVHDQKVVDALETLQQRFASNQDFSAFAPRMQTLRQDLTAMRASLLERHADEVLQELEREIVARFMPRSERIASGLDTDRQVQTAVEILRDQSRYSKILNLSVADGDQ